MCRAFFHCRIRRMVEGGGWEGAARAGGGGLLRPCFTNQPTTMLFTAFLPVYTSCPAGCLMFRYVQQHEVRPQMFRTSANMPPCYLQHFRLFIRHVARGCLMFSNTWCCHRCSFRFASMPKTLLFIAILPRYTTCVSLKNLQLGLALAVGSQSGCRGSLGERVRK